MHSLDKYLFLQFLLPHSFMVHRFEIETDVLFYRNKEKISVLSNCFSMAKCNILKSISLNSLHNERSAH